MLDLLNGVHQAAGQVPVEHAVEAHFFEALGAFEGVKADGDEHCGLQLAPGPLALLGEIVAQDDSAQGDSDGHEGRLGEGLVDVGNDLGHVLAVAGAVGPGRGQGVTAPASKIKHNASRSKLLKIEIIPYDITENLKLVITNLVGNVDEALDVLGLGGSGKAGKKENDGTFIALGRRF